MRLPSPLRIEAERAALLLIDLQERLWLAMSGADRAMCAKNVGILIELARRLNIPVVQSEQYPRGLGPTVDEVAARLAAPGLEVRKLEKLEFSCAEAPGFAEIWDDLRRDQWIVVGMEAHVCVYQSARDLAERGAAVHLPADAVISRTHENRAVGLELVRRAGGYVTSTETVAFDALKRAGTDDFRAVLGLIR